MALAQHDITGWYLKAGWSGKLNALGATHFYGEYGKQRRWLRPGYDDRSHRQPRPFVSSDADRFGLGVVQEIDAAAMSLWAKWRHHEYDATLQGWHRSASRSRKRRHVPRWRCDLLLSHRPPIEIRKRAVLGPPFFVGAGDTRSARRPPARLTSPSPRPSRGRNGERVGVRGSALPPLPIPALNGERVGARGSCLFQTRCCPSPKPSPREGRGEGTRQQLLYVPPEPARFFHRRGFA